MGRVVSAGEKRQRPVSVIQARTAMQEPSEPEVSPESLSLTEEPVLTSETHYENICEDCYHMRSNWSKFLDWIRRVLWVM